MGVFSLLAYPLFYYPGRGRRKQWAIFAWWRRAWSLLLATYHSHDTQRLVRRKKEKKWARQKGKPSAATARWRQPARYSLGRPPPRPPPPTCRRRPHPGWSAAGSSQTLQNHTQLLSSGSSRTCLVLGYEDCVDECVPLNSRENRACLKLWQARSPLGRFALSFVSLHNVDELSDWKTYSSPLESFSNMETRRQFTLRPFSFWNILPVIAWMTWDKRRRDYNTRICIGTWLCSVVIANNLWYDITLASFTQLNVSVGTGARNCYGTH